MKLLLFAILTVSALLGLGQYREIHALRVALETQRQNPEITEQNRDGSLQAYQHCPSPGQIVTMRAERSELLRLRASFPELRAIARSEDEVRAEIARLNKRIALEKQSAKAIEDTFQENQSAKAVQATLQSIAVLMQIGSTNPETVANAHPFASDPRHKWESLAASHPTFQDQFESIPARPAPARAILLRERYPRALSSDMWTRLYLLADYGIEKRTQKGQDFTAWESGSE